MNCKKFGMELLVVVMAVLLAAGPAYAFSMGSQYVSRPYFGDNNITRSEIYAAEASLSEAGVLPDSPLYGLKRLAETVVLMFTFDETGQARLRLRFSELRLAETMRMVEKNNPDGVKRAGEDLAAGMGTLESAISRLGDQNLSREAGEVFGRSAIALAIALEKVPDDVRPTIEKAFNYSLETRAKSAGKDDDEIEHEIKDEAETIRSEVRKKLDSEKSGKTDEAEDDKSGSGSGDSEPAGDDSGNSGSDSGSSESSSTDPYSSSGSGSGSSGSSAEPDNSGSSGSSSSSSGSGSSGSDDSKSGDG